jgi:hypothetical protein
MKSVDLGVIYSGELLNISNIRVQAPFFRGEIAGILTKLITTL